MASIDRTAYPRFKPSLSQRELEALYEPTDDEIAFEGSQARRDRSRLTLLVLLKCHQRLGYLPQARRVPEGGRRYLARWLRVPEETALGGRSRQARHRYRRAIHRFLKVRTYSEGGRDVATTAVREAAFTMSDPANLVNVAIEQLVRHRYELPAFSTLDRFVGQIRQQVHERLYEQLTAPLTREERRQLDALLEVQPGEFVTDFTRMKETPGPATLKRMRRTHSAAREKLRELQEQHREIEEEMLAAFAEVVERAEEAQTDAALGREVRVVLTAYGGAEVLKAKYHSVSAYHHGNYLPLLWDFHHRTALFDLLDLLRVEPASQDRSLVEALHFIRHYRHARRDFLPYEIDLGFLSHRWRAFVETRHAGELVLKRRELEVCVMSHVADGRAHLRRLKAKPVPAGTEALKEAVRDVIAEYARFELPFLWGSGKAAVADGTHVELVENNLLGERHIRYGSYGGIAYHHISDTYIALFSHFIACGVWEAVYILDGLLKNQSVLQPDTVHADTQGQSEPVYGLAYLLGIKLMPRMRTWDDVAFYRPSPEATYQPTPSSRG